MIRQLTIIGTGLIGGSFAAAIKAGGFPGGIVAFDRPEVLEKALRLGVVDKVASNLKEAVRDADAVVLATPVSAILTILPEVATSVQEGALVTDVGSTKRRICETAWRYLDGRAHFIGGHPMAGSERQGLDAASATLFEKATYILTPKPATPAIAVRPLAELIALTGAQVVLMTPEEHDRMAAVVSHMPQVVSLALINCALKTDERYVTWSAGGFRDATRTAASPFELWADIFQTNADYIELALEQFMDLLQRYKSQLTAAALREEFQKAHQGRERMLGG